MEIRVTRSATIPTGRYRSQRVEYGLSMELDQGSSDKAIRKGFARAKKLVERELRRAKQQIEREEDDDDWSSH